LMNNDGTIWNQTFYGAINNDLPDFMIWH
jgi:hypothetical protein